MAGQAKAGRIPIERSCPDARFFQPCQADAAGAGIGIAHPDDNTGQPCCRYQVGTGGTALRAMCARLQRDIECCFFRCLARRLQSHGLGMGTAPRHGPAAPHHHAILYNQCAHARIGAGQRACPLCQCGSGGQPARVVSLRSHVGNIPPPTGLVPQGLALPAHALRPVVRPLSLPQWNRHR